ncbi:MAG: glucoamylase family protein [Ignavibacteriaceae bacterium]
MIKFIDKYQLVIFIVFFSSVICCSQNKITKTSYTLIQDKNSPEVTAFLDTLEYKTFLYFIDESNRENGLVKDRSADYSPASIAAVGFALPAYAVGAEHNWITRTEAAERTLNTLNFFLNSKQSAEPVSTGYKGFYYHFLDMKKGLRHWNSELSSIDTGLLLAGIIFSRQYFDRNTSREKEIREKSALILNRVDWKFFTMSPDSKFPYDISMGWQPDKGFSGSGWKGYNEAQILFVIAAGDGMENADKAYNTWQESYSWQEPYKGLAQVVFPPLFGHQFTSVFIDLKGIADKYMRSKGIDYFENSRRATLTQRLYAIENPHGWKGYDSLTWGISACDGPGESYDFDDKKFWGYAGRGTSGPQYNYFDDGTIAPYASGSSIVFAPEVVIPTLMHLYNAYKDKGIWGKYGFVDAFNLTVNWFDKEDLGIDEGPLVLMLENYRSGLIWKYMMKDPIIKKGLKILGFRKL